MSEIKNKKLIYSEAYGKEGILDEKTINSPYLEYVVRAKTYNPNFGDNKMCKCGHTYARHFDSYENMEPVGCKYCDCREFVLDDTIEKIKELNIPDTPLEQYELSVRCFVCLKANNITTAKQLIETADGEIRMFRNIGNRAADEAISLKTKIIEEAQNAN